MPAPSAVISVPISWLPSILSKRARSTLRIFPRSGSTAWNARLRPCLAEPPALSPSTMKSSDFAGSRSWQSARFAGSLARRRRGDHLADDDLGFRRMLLEPVLQRLVDEALDHRPHLGGNQ